MRLAGRLLKTAVAVGLCNCLFSGVLTCTSCLEVVPICVNTRPHLHAWQMCVSAEQGNMCVQGVGLDMVWGGDVCVHFRAFACACALQSVQHAYVCRRACIIARSTGRCRSAFYMCPYVCLSTPVPFCLHSWTSLQIHIRLSPCLLPLPPKQPSPPPTPRAAGAGSIVVGAPHMFTNSQEVISVMVALVPLFCSMLMLHTSSMATEGIMLAGTPWLVPAFRYFWRQGLGYGALCSAACWGLGVHACVSCRLMKGVWGCRAGPGVSIG